MTDRKSWALGAASCILGSVDNFTKEGFSLYTNAGIKYCELSIWPQHMERFDFIDHPEKLGKVISDAGVSVYSLHLPYTDGATLSSPDEEITKASLDIIKKAVRSAAKLGAKVVVIHPAAGHFDEWNTREEMINHSIACVKEICEYADSFGIKCAVENLPRLGIGRTPQEIIAYLREIPSLGMCFDLNHSLLQTNEEYFAELAKAGMHGRIYHIHVSDYDMEDEKHWLPGKGINDWEMILSKLEEFDYSGAFMYEVSASSATCESIAENYRSLMKLIG